MLGISLAEVYECVGKYVISSVKRLKRANRCILRQWKKLRKRSGFVIYSWYVKDSAFTVVEKGCKVLYLVCEMGRTSGWSLSVYHFCSTPWDVVNWWRSPKNAHLRGRSNVFPVVALLHRKVTRDDRKYVAVESLLQMKPLPLCPCFSGEFLPLRTLPKEMFVFFWIFKLGTVRIDKVLILPRKRWIPAMNIDPDIKAHKSFCKWTFLWCLIPVSNLKHSFVLILDNEWPTVIGVLFRLGNQC